MKKIDELKILFLPFMFLVGCSPGAPTDATGYILEDARIVKISNFLASLYADGYG